MKKIYSILVTIVFLILTASCNENFEIADKADSLVSVAINTLNIQKSFNVGESYQAELWVQRGGLSDMSGKVKFMIDPNLTEKTEPIIKCYRKTVMNCPTLNFY